MTAGTVIVSEERLYNVQKIIFSWTSGNLAQSGTASGTTTYPYTGQILRATTVPGVATAPDNLYDITLTNEDSVDVAIGLLANRSGTSTEWVTSGMGAVVGDKLTINVTNAGDDNTGELYVYIGMTPEEAASDTVAVQNALFGSGGISDWPEATAPADGANLAEAVAYMVERQIGTIDNTTGVPTLGGVLGDFGNESLALRLDMLDAMLARAVGYEAVKNVSYNGAASYAGFAVSGVVAVKCVGHVRSALTNDAATTSVGTASSAAGLIAATAGSAMQTVDQLWVDNAPSKFETFPANWTLISEAIAVDGDAALITGTVTLHCYWFPVSANATLAAA